MDGSRQKSVTLFKYKELQWTGDIPNNAGIQVNNSKSNKDESFIFGILVGNAVLFHLNL